MDEVLEKHGTGWVDYLWPKPSTKEVSKKWNYIKRFNVTGTPAFIGVGADLDWRWSTATIAAP